MNPPPTIPRSALIAPETIVDDHTDVLLDLIHPRRHPDRTFFVESADGHVDLPRLRRGRIGAAFVACFVPDDDARAGHALPDTLRMVDLLRRLVDASAGEMEQVRDTDQLVSCLARGVFGAILHYEGADAIDPDLAILRLSHALGLRLLGLTWSRPNIFAQGVGPDDTGQGLTDAGHRLVHACNDLGVLIDVSHLNDAGFEDVLNRSSEPIVASHSNCRAISPHPRNLTDDQIRALAANGGLLGLNFAVRFLWPDMAARSDLPLDLMVDHIDHVVDLVGVDHVALGTDYDGTMVPDAVGDAGKAQALIGRLRARGYDDEQIAAICHGNWLRVLRAVWR